MFTTKEFYSIKTIEQDYTITINNGALTLTTINRQIYMNYIVVTLYLHHTHTITL